MLVSELDSLPDCIPDSRLFSYSNSVTDCDTRYLILLMDAIFVEYSNFTSCHFVVTTFSDLRLLFERLVQKIKFYAASTF